MGRMRIGDGILLFGRPWPESVVRAEMEVDQHTRFTLPASMTVPPSYFLPALDISPCSDTVVCFTLIFLPKNTLHTVVLVSARLCRIRAG